MERLNGQPFKLMPNCPDGDNNRQEWPSITNGPDNEKRGHDRVVYIKKLKELQ